VILKDQENNNYTKTLNRAELYSRHTSTILMLKYAVFCFTGYVTVRHKVNEKSSQINKFYLVAKDLQYNNISIQPQVNMFYLVAKDLQYNNISSQPQIF